MNRYSVIWLGTQQVLPMWSGDWMNKCEKNFGSGRTEEASRWRELLRLDLEESVRVSDRG